MVTIRIGEHVCDEAEVAAIMEAVDLFVGVAQGQLAEIGQQICNDYLSRKDITAEFRQRVRRIQELFKEAHSLLHDSGDFKASFDLAQDAVPIIGVRAFQVLCRLNGDEKGLVKAMNYLRNQAEMASPE